MPTVTEVMHRGAMDLQEGAMSPLGVERKVATKTVTLTIQKMQKLGNGGTKRDEVLAGQSVIGTEVGE